MRKIKFQLILLLFLITAALAGLAYWYTAPNSTAPIVALDNKKFSDQHLISIQKDSLVKYIYAKYSTDVVVEDKRELKIKLSNQGTRLSSFYNNNGNLLKVNDKGFSITPNTYNGSLEATFKKDKINKTEYVQLPTDVVAGIVQ
jgi:hypothetical protein